MLQGFPRDFRSLPFTPSTAAGPSLPGAGFPGRWGGQRSGCWGKSNSGFGPLGVCPANVSPDFLSGSLGPAAVSNPRGRTVGAVRIVHASSGMKGTCEQEPRAAHGESGFLHRELYATDPRSPPLCHVGNWWGDRDRAWPRPARGGAPPPSSTPHPRPRLAGPARGPRPEAGQSRVPRARAGCPVLVGGGTEGSPALSVSLHLHSNPGLH